MSAAKNKEMKEYPKDPMTGERDEHELDAVTRAYLVELQNHVNTVTKSANDSMNVALQLEVRRAGLKGSWQISPDGTKLIRTEDKNPAQ